MKGNNFHHSAEVVLALAPQTVGIGATANGPSIVEPWKKGNQLAIILVGGAIGTNGTGTCTVQGLRRSDGTTWEALKGSDNATNLTFPTADLADAGTLENGVLLGTIPLKRVDGVTYSAIRISYSAAVATALVGATGIIYELVEKPSSQVDKLFSQLVP